MRPLVVSFLPWITLLAISASRSRPEYMEGDAFLMIYASILAFVVVGPLTGVMLSVIMRVRAVDCEAFARIFLLVALPLLCSQALIYGGSAFSAFFFPSANQIIDVVFGGLVATSFYVLMSVILYAFAKRGVAATVFAAIGLTTLSVAILVGQMHYEVIRPLMLPFHR
jgi:hypothetical protein